MSHTNTFMNWKGVTYTVPSGSPVSMLEILDIQEINSETLEPWQADGNRFATQLISASAIRGLTIIGGNVAQFMLMPRNTPLTIVGILYDSVNGVGSGALTHTWINAVIADVPASGPSNKFAGGTLTLMCYSSDGSTDPLTIAQAT